MRGAKPLSPTLHAFMIRTRTSVRFRTGKHETDLIYKAENLFVCLFVCTLYKLTFPNQSEPNFAHISPLVWKRP
jgi:hypothetical protein